MLDEVGIAVIGEAAGELSNEVEAGFDLAEEQAAGVGGDGSAIETGDDFAGAEEREIQITRVGRGRFDQPLLRMLSLTVRVSAVVGLPCSDSLLYTLSSSGCLSY